jgi:hypothetical protein
MNNLSETTTPAKSEAEQIRAERQQEMLQKAREADGYLDGAADELEALRDELQEISEESEDEEEAEEAEDRAEQVDRLIDALNDVRGGFAKLRF